MGGISVMIKSNVLKRIIAVTLFVTIVILTMQYSSICIDKQQIIEYFSITLEYLISIIVFTIVFLTCIIKDKKTPKKIYVFWFYIYMY